MILKKSDIITLFVFAICNISHLINHHKSKFLIWRTWTQTTVLCGLLRHPIIEPRPNNLFKVLFRHRTHVPKLPQDLKAIGQYAVCPGCPPDGEYDKRNSTFKLENCGEKLSHPICLIFHGHVWNNNLCYS